MDYNLKTELEKGRHSRLNFVFLKGSKEHHFLVSKKEVSKSLIEGIEDGSPKRLAKGICHFEGSDLVCATRTSAPSGWSTAVKHVLKDCHFTVSNVIFKQLGEKESDEVDGEDESEAGKQKAQNETTAEPAETTSEASPAGPAEEMAPPPPPPMPPPLVKDPAKPLTATLSKIAPLIKNAYETHPERKDEIVDLIQTFQTELGAKEFDQAKASLTKVVTILKSLGHHDEQEEEETEGETATVSEEFRKKWAAAKQEWEKASDSIDAQIKKLQSALKQSEDDGLREISSFGFNGVTGNFKVPLVSAIRDIDEAAPDAVKPLAGKAIKIIKGFVKHIEAEPRITACDANPFDIPVTIRDTIVPALENLRSVLAAV